MLTPSAQKGINSMSDSKTNWKKSIIIVLIFITLLSSSLSAVLWIREGYTDKILFRLGFKNDLIGEDYWALKSWTSCLVNLDLDVDVVFFGDSITRGGLFQKYYSNTRICNLGYSGDTILGLNKRIEMVSAVKPEKIFILIGINDIFQNASLKILTYRYNTLIANLRTSLPDSSLFIQSILPINKELKHTFVTNDYIMKVNDLLKNIATENKITYIDLYSIYAVNGSLPKEKTPDGIHLKSESYALWIEELIQYLE